MSMRSDLRFLVSQRDMLIRLMMDLLEMVVLVECGEDVFVYIRSRDSVS